MADAPTPPSAAEALIAELERGGSVEASGSFSLDHNVARQKVARFALPDPLDYVLMLVRSAVRQGAQHLRFDIDADDLRLTFDGRPFTVLEFHKLYDSLLGEREAREAGGLHELAMAVNTAQEHSTRWIRVASGDGNTGAFLEVQPGQPALYGATGDAPLGTSLHVKRARGRTPGRIAASLANRLPEERRLRRRARYAEVRIDLEGARLDGGLQADDLLAATPVEPGPGIEALQGQAGFRVGALDSGEIRVVRDGVWVEALAEPNLCAGFVAVIQSPALRTDLTGFRVVRNRAWEALRPLVQAAHRRCLEGLLRWYESDLAHGVMLRARLDAAGYPDVHALAWLHQLLRATLRRQTDLEALLDHGLDPLVKRFAALDVWDLLPGRRSPSGRTSLHELARRAHARQRIALCMAPDDATPRTHPHLPWSDAHYARLVRADTAAEAQHLATLLGDRLDRY